MCMKIRKQIFTGCLMLACIAALIPASPAGAAVKEINKTSHYDITAERKEEALEESQKQSDFPEQIAENDVVYVRQEISAAVKTEAPDTKTETVYQTKRSEVIPAGEEYEPQKTIKKAGVTYTLVQTTKKKKTLVKAKKETVTAYTIYRSKAAAGAAPATRKAKTSSGKTVVCSKTGAIRKLSDTWKDSYIDITFVSYDADHYIWNGITVEKNANTPLAGYEKELMKSVGLTPSTCRVKSISYTGKAYRNSNGVLCRKARAKIRKKVKQYRVNYTGVKKTKALTGTVYTLLYAGEKEVKTGKTVYGVTVTASYEKKTYLPSVVLTVGIVLALMALSGILLLLAKRRKNPKNEKYVQLYPYGKAVLKKMDERGEEMDSPDP